MNLGTIAKTVILAAGFTFFGCNYDAGKKIDSVNSNNILQQAKLISDSNISLYANNNHGGLDTGSINLPSKDFDEDGFYDGYNLCRDRSIIARLSSRNNNRSAGSVRTGSVPEYWFDIGKIPLR